MAEKPLPVTPSAPSGSSSWPLSSSGTTTLPSMAPRDEIARSLAPLIAVVASQDAEEICQSNHIPTFADFIKPFGNMIQGRVSPRDWQGTPIAIDNFNVRFRRIDRLDEPNASSLLSVVSDYVKASHEPKDSTQQQQHIKTRADVGDAYLDTPLDMVTPWYADFRRLILSYRGIAEHETFDHPVATLIVISSANPDPMGTIMQLYNPNIPSFTVDKPYVDPNILRFYLLLHDPHKTTLEHSQSVFEKMKRTFGLHCHMLTINSRPRPPATDFFDELANNDVMAEDHIRMIWEKELNESQSIETKLQMYADQPNFSHQSQLVPLSPALSGASSDLVRSNATSPSISGLPSNTVHSTDLQVGPLEMNESDEALSSKPSPTEGQLISDADSPAVQYGRYFTDDDIEATRSMVKELVVQSLIPFMERNIQHWNEQVASARRGLTGRLFGASRRFFGTSSRTASPQSMQTIPATGPNVPPGMTTVMIYPYAAPEAQMRKLADYAFMIRDYKFAHAIYDTVRRDYATEKAYKYHAGTQEMIGLCQLIMNQPLASKNDVDRNFELAVQQYLGRCRSPFYATRTTVMYYELLKARRMWREIPTALVRMTGEDSDLRSALFLEQAAHCFLRAPRPLVRKYGFHLVMAGHRYGKAAQRHHAFRCYKMASFILTGDQWSVAKNHVQFALGRQAFHLGHLEEAVSYFADVLADTKQTPQQQLAHVREFLFIYRQYTSQAGIDPLKVSLPHLALPTIFDQMIRINLFNSQSNTETQEEWAAMEMELLEENITSGYIAKSKKALAIEQQDDNRVVCAVGEPAMAHITLYNPLQISIQLSHLVLGCKHRASTQRDTKEEADGTADLDETMPQGTPVTGTDMLSYGDFELQAIPDITLEPLEQRTLHLAIVPRREGSLKVTGLHYTLNDLVHSFRPFHKKGRRLNATKEQRMTPTYAPDRTLDILVTSPMPLLDVAFHQIPETILSGEVVQAVLEINNRGHKGLTALRMKSSHPSFICVGQPDELGKRIYTEKDKGGSETCHIDNRIYDSSVISIPLPSENDRPGIVGPGHTTLVPLWIRGDRIGKHSFKFLFSYQSEEENTAIAHRTLRYALGVQVLPSLKINAFTRPSTTGTNEFILGIEIENLQTVANFDLTQLTLASPAWTIVPLSINMESKDDIQEKATVPARQTSFAYYKIKRIESVDLAKHSDSPEAWTSNALEALLNNDADRSVAPPPLDLHISKLAFKGSGIAFDTAPLKSFAFNSRMHWRLSNLKSTFPNIAEDQYGKRFTMYTTNDVDLTIYWDVSNMQRHGHHYIIGVNLGVVQNPFQGTIGGAGRKSTSRTMFEATAKERTALIASLTKNKALQDESPIKLMVKAIDRYEHDFNVKGHLRVPIEIVLRNCSWNKTTNYTLQMISWSDSKAMQSPKIKPTFNIHPFHWSGTTVFSGVLEPDGTETVQAYAIFQAAGVYDINRWKLTMHTCQDGLALEDVEHFVHLPNLSHIITIGDTS